MLAWGGPIVGGVKVFADRKWSGRAALYIRNRSALHFGRRWHLGEGPGEEILVHIIHGEAGGEVEAAPARRRRPPATPSAAKEVAAAESGGCRIMGHPVYSRIHLPTQNTHRNISACLRKLGLVLGISRSFLRAFHSRDIFYNYF